MRSSISGPNAHRNTMFPMMCDQLACMNIDVRIVTRCCPATMSAGTSAHLVTKASPPVSSSRKTKTLTAMMDAVTTGTRFGRREASLRGIRPTATSDPDHRLQVDHRAELERTDNQRDPGDERKPCDQSHDRSEGDRGREQCKQPRDDAEHAERPGPTPLHAKILLHEGGVDAEDAGQREPPGHHHDRERQGEGRIIDQRGDTEPDTDQAGQQQHPPVLHHRLQLDRLDDFDAAAKEGPERDHERECGDGIEWPGEDVDAHRETEQTAQHERPPRAVVHSPEITEHRRCHTCLHEGCGTAGVFTLQARPGGVAARTSQMAVSLAYSPTRPSYVTL